MARIQKVLHIKRTLNAHFNQGLTNLVPIVSVFFLCGAFCFHGEHELDLGRFDVFFDQIGDDGSIFQIDL